MKYILIESRKATPALKALADSEEGLICLRIPNDDVAAAMVLLNAINEDYWCSSDEHKITEGDTTDSILLPKKAINA